jgi:hypothetical protein
MTMLLSASGAQLDIYKGDSLDLRLEVQEEKEDGSRGVYPITGATLWFTVKAAIKSTEILIQKVSTDALQIDIDSPSAGRALIHLTPFDTNLLACRTYYYDVRIITASGQRYTIVPPSLFIVHDPLTVLAT